MLLEPAREATLRRGFFRHIAVAAVGTPAVANVGGNVGKVCVSLCALRGRTKGVSIISAENRMDCGVLHGDRSVVPSLILVPLIGDLPFAFPSSVRK